MSKAGCETPSDFIVGKTRTIDSIMEEFDAIFVGAGAGLPWFMNIRGKTSTGVYSANEYLTRCNLMKAYRFRPMTPP